MANYIVLADYSDNVRSFAAATIVSGDLHDVHGLARSGCALVPLTDEIQALVPGYLAQRAADPSASFAAIVFASQLKVGPVVAFSDSAVLFTRNSEASYMLLQEPPFTDPGNNVLIAWAPRDTLRRTDEGLLIIENSPTFTNVAKRGFAGWSAGTATLTPNAAAGPDGVAAIAVRVQATGVQNGPYALPGPAPNAASAWVRRRDGDYAGLYQGVLGTTGAFDVVRDFPTEFWTRYDWATVSSAGDGFIPVDGRATSPPMTAQPIDVLVDLLSIEQGARHPTSSVRVDLINARDRDSLYVSPTEVPLTLRTGRSLWTLAPQWGTADLVSGDVKVVGAFGTDGDCLRMRHTGADVRLEAFVGGTVRASSVALSFVGSFTAPAPSFDVVVDAEAGSISVDGVVGPPGSPWAWDDGPYRHGGSMSGGLEFCGGISLPMVSA